MTPDANGWYPIESAPRDGTIVTLKSDDFGGYESSPLYWDQKIKKWVGESFLLGGKRKVYWDMKIAKPTHWQPLGQPPVGVTV